MSAVIYEALLACDEARYTPGLSLAQAQSALNELVAKDAEEARLMLADLQGCPRTRLRHEEYLRQALADL